MTGKVIIAGAGCGKADMMTLRALNALKAADVVVYDRLLGDDVLSLIPENAEKINAGKASGNHLIPQDEINKILLEKAKENKTAVRLKGGDPFVFGRGGEEAEYLINNGISVEIIPGISSSYAAPLFAGIPVTHRGVSSSLHIMTGHFKDDSEINYKALSQTGGTFVFLMGLKNADKIQNGLISAGLDKNTPCAVIENGGSAKQRVGVSALSELSNLALGFSSPAIIVVGEVCRLREKLFSKKPLDGRNIVVCRPFCRSVRLKNMLENAGAVVNVVPSIKITPFDVSANDIANAIKSHKYVVFTSRTGVELTMKTLFSAEYDVRVFGNAKIAVIGAGTAQTLKNHGLKYDLMPNSFYSDELAKLLVSEKADDILILRAENGSKDINDILTENKIKFTDMYIYKTEAEEEQSLPQKYDTVIFASPSEAEYFKPMRNGFKAVCIGKRTFEAAKKRGFDCYAAKEQSDNGIFECLINEVK